MTNKKIELKFEKLPDGSGLQISGFEGLGLSEEEIKMALDCVGAFALRAQHINECSNEELALRLQLLSEMAKGIGETFCGDNGGLTARLLH